MMQFTAADHARWWACDNLILHNDSGVPYDGKPCTAELRLYALQESLMLAAKGAPLELSRHEAEQVRDFIGDWLAELTRQEAGSDAA